MISLYPRAARACSAVEVSDQDASQGTVIIDEITAAEQGWIVIHLSVFFVCALDEAPEALAGKAGTVIAADFAPVFDPAAVNVGDLLDRQPVDLLRLWAKTDQEGEGFLEASLSLEPADVVDFLPERHAVEHVAGRDSSDRDVRG